MAGDEFAALFGAPYDYAATAPGRVNLIGEHTDYNDGFVLPMPIPQETRAEIKTRGDDLVRAYSREIGTRGRDERPRTYRVGAEARTGAWIDYVQGVTSELLRDGHELSGFDLHIQSNVPVGSGLSSSAALEISVLRALREVFALPIDDVTVAKLGRRAENNFIGAPVGIMDQMVSSLGVHGSALFIDTRTLDYRRIEIPREVELCVIESGVAHSHATGDYRVRRSECEHAARLLGVTALRDVAPADLPRIAALPEPLNRRARHVVTENARVLDALSAMAKGDLPALGKLFLESHASMRDDFEVSVKEIDLLVELARSRPEVYGARLTGGGFGGSIVALAQRGTAARVARAICNDYDARSGKKSRVLLPFSA